MITDDFNRANNADLGSAWDAGYTGFSATQISGNDVRPSAVGQNCVESNNSEALNADQYAQVKITGLNTALEIAVGVILRASASPTATFYVVFAFGTDLIVRKYVAGVSTDILSASGTFAVNDVIKAEVTGSSIVVRQNGAIIAAATDTSVASGRPGILLYVEAAGSVADAQLDDFAAGDASGIRFINAGTEGSASSGNITLGAPASPQTNDIWIASIHSSDQVTHSFTDWTEIAQGNGGGTTSHLSVWYFRYAGSTPNLTVTHSGGQSPIGGITAWRGCKTSGSPVNVISSIGTGTDASIEHTAITPGVNDCMILAINGSADDNARTTIPSGFFAALEDTSASAQNCFITTAGNPDGSVAQHWLLQGTLANTGTVTDTQAAGDAWASYLLALEPAGSGSALTKDVADGLSIGDTRAGAAGFNRSQADAMVMAEVLANVATYLRSLGDTISIGDTSALAMASARLLEDGLSVGDTLATLLMLNKAITDGMTLDEVIALASAFARSQTDALSLTEAIVKAIGLVRTDEITISEALDRITSFVRALSDAIGLADSIVASSFYNRAFSDGMSLDETVARILVVIRLVSDTITISEAIALVGSFVRSHADSIMLNESVAPAAEFVRLQADAIAISEILSSISSWVRIRTDAIDIAESIDVELLEYLIKQVSDSMNLADVMTKIMEFARNNTEAVSMSDSVVYTLLFARLMSDGMSITEAIAIVGAFNRETMDAIVVSDTVAKIIAFVRTQSDALTVGEQLLRSAAFVRSKSDATALGESVSRSLIFYRLLSDAILLDSMAAYGRRLSRLAPITFRMIQQSSQMSIPPHRLTIVVQPMEAPPRD